MFQFSELKNVHIEITNRCQASCPMCHRNIHGGISNKLLKETDWTVNEFKLVFNRTVLIQLHKISFCGTFGDPIMNNDLIEMCRYIKDTAPHIDIRIHTNGSARTAEWWSNLIAALPKNHLIEFALDGLEDTHHLHRIGTSFNKVIENAKTVIAQGGRASWLFIKFKHNEHQVSIAKQMSEDLGFSRFVLKNTRRFDGNKFAVLNKDGLVSHFLEQPTNNVVNFVNKHDLKNYQKWPAEVSCFALDTTEIYIDVNFTILPCCIIAAFLYTNYDIQVLKQYQIYDESTSLNSIGTQIQRQVFDIIQELGGIETLNARAQGIKQVINSAKWQTIWKDKWENNGSMCCTIMCSTTSPFVKIEQQMVKSDVQV